MPATDTVLPMIHLKLLMQLLVACIGSQAREIFVGDKGIRKILHIQ